MGPRATQQRGRSCALLHSAPSMQEARCERTTGPSPAEGPEVAVGTTRGRQNTGGGGRRPPSSRVRQAGLNLDPIICCCEAHPFLPLSGSNFLRVFLLFFFLILFRATPEAYGSFQARGRIGATAAGHSHSLTGPELHLRPPPQLTETPDP